MLKIELPLDLANSILQTLAALPCGQGAALFLAYQSAANAALERAKLEDAEAAANAAPATTGEPAA